MSGLRAHDPADATPGLHCRCWDDGERCCYCRRNDEGPCGSAGAEAERPPRSDTIDDRLGEAHKSLARRDLGMAQVEATLALVAAVREQTEALRGLQPRGIPLRRPDGSRR